MYNCRWEFFLKGRCIVNEVSYFEVIWCMGYVCYFFFIKCYIWEIYYLLYFIVFSVVFYLFSYVFIFYVYKVKMKKRVFISCYYLFFYCVFIWDDFFIIWVVNFFICNSNDFIIYSEYVLCLLKKWKSIIKWYLCDYCVLYWWVN